MSVTNSTNLEADADEAIYRSGGTTTTNLEADVQTYINTKPVYSTNIEADVTAMQAPPQAPGQSKPAVAGPKKVDTPPHDKKVLPKPRFAAHNAPRGSLRAHTDNVGGEKVTEFEISRDLMAIKGADGVSFYQTPRGADGKVTQMQGFAGAPVYSEQDGKILMDRAHKDPKQFIEDMNDRVYRDGVTPAPRVKMSSEVYTVAAPPADTAPKAQTASAIPKFDARVAGSIMPMGGG